MTMSPEPREDFYAKTRGRSNRIQWKEPVSALLLDKGVGAGVFAF